MSSSHALPDVLMRKVDEYVDSLAPQIQPRIAAELDTFQRVTIDSLEDQIVGAFRSLFGSDDDNNNKGGSKRGRLDEGVPDVYGGASLPFADEISKLTRSVSFGEVVRGAGEDVRGIFDLTEGNNGGREGRVRGGDGGGQTDRGLGGGRGGKSGSGDGFKSFLSAAVDVVQDRFEGGRSTGGGGGGGKGFELDGLLGVISNTVKDAARNPEEKARMITPEIKERVGAELKEQHAPIAERFTRIALEHIKKWLRGNTSSRDLGDGAKGEIEEQVKDLVKGLGGLFGSKKHGHGNEGSARGFGGGDEDRDRAGGAGESKERGGFSKIISEKLSTGLARVHREVRLEFRKVLAEIEKKLFELLPDKFQRPLEKILGGNPFDSQLDRDIGVQSDRGFDDIKTTLLRKIRGLIQKVQETLRESILGVVNGGHRKFEHQSWVFVQNMVEQKVQKYLPKVKITVPDDIGNEGVSVGAPTSNIQLGGGHQTLPPSSSPGGYAPPPPPQTTFPSSPGGYAPPPPQTTFPTSPGGYAHPPPPQTTFPPPPSQEYVPSPSHEYQAPPFQQHPPLPSHNYPSSPSQQNPPAPFQEHRPPAALQDHAAPPSHDYPPRPPKEYAPPAPHDYPPPTSQQQGGYNPTPQYKPYRPEQQEGYYPSPPPPAQQPAHQQYSPQEYNPPHYTPQKYNPEDSQASESQGYYQNEGQSQGQDYHHGGAHHQQGGGYGRDEKY